MAEVYPWCNKVVVRQRVVIDGVKDEAKACERRAVGNLQAARAATEHEKIKGPSKLTKIKLTKAPDRVADWFVEMHAPNPYAIEYGHYPSGFFAPAKYGSITKAPAGLYILTRAALLAGANFTPGPTRYRGKR